VERQALDPVGLGLELGLLVREGEREREEKIKERERKLGGEHWKIDALKKMRPCAALSTRGARKYDDA
jgi:hypothetical protein